MTTIMGYPISVLALIFPPLTDQKFEAMVMSIKERGLLVPIVLWRGQVIDGRHRLLACLESGVEPTFEEIPDDANPLDYVMDLNNRRRHMNESQRAIAAYRVWEESFNGWQSLGDIESANLHSYTLKEASALFNVSRRLVIHAGKVVGRDSAAIAELKRVVEHGIIAVSDASRVVNEDPEVQERAMEMVTAGKSRTVSASVKVISQEASGPAETDKECGPPRWVGEGITLYHSTVAGLGLQTQPDSVDVLVVMPPRDGPLQVFSDAAALAGRVLKEDGVLVVGADAERLPELLGRLKNRDLEWVSLFYLLYPNIVVASEGPHWVSARCLPLLVYGKPGYRLGGGEAVMEVPRTLYSGADWLGVIDAGKERVVNRFALRGQVVCDAMLCGSSGAVLAAWDGGCTFIGADDDESRLDRVHDALTSGVGGADGQKEKMEIRQMSFA